MVVATTHSASEGWTLHVGTAQEVVDALDGNRNASAVQLTWNGTAYAALVKYDGA